MSEKQQDLAVARMIFEEAIKEYKDGDLTWRQMAEEVKRSLEALK